MNFRLLCICVILVISSKATPFDPKKNCNQTYCHEEVGVYTYPNGTLYQGEFRNGKPEGKAKITYRDGTSYIGFWKYDSPNGEGKYISNLDTLCGIWKDGRLLKRIPNYTVYDKVEPIINSTKRGDTHAIIVGIASYTTLPSLKYTDDDAYRLYAFLRSPEGGAVSDSRIKVLIDEDATATNILDAIIEKSNLMKPNDMLFIYLSGHGADGAFIPFDFKNNKNHIPYLKLLDEINKINCRNIIVVNDACHSGSMQQKSGDLPAVMKLIDKQTQSKGNRFFITSSRKDEVSLEHSGMRQGIFSYYLIKALTGDADFNHDKLVDLSEIKSYLSSSVSKYTAGRQNPLFFGSFDPSFPFSMVR